MIIGTGTANANCPEHTSGGNSPAVPGRHSPDSFPGSVVRGIASVPVPQAGGGAAAAAGTSGGNSPLGSYTLTDNACTRRSDYEGISKLLTVIRRDKRLRQYYHISRQFVLYLRAMDTMGLCVSGFNNRDNKGIDIGFAANHRWTTAYRNKLLAKLYLLDDYIKENPSPVTLMTLTVFQDGEYSESMLGEKLTIPESFELLKKSWKKLSMMVRNILPGCEYIWIVEPHKSGYPHLHLALFADVPLGTQERLKRLWSEKYHAGSFENGIDFEIRRPEQSIESLRNYLMKYIAKGFVSTGSRFGGEGWTAAELVFNACVWDGNYRTFQPSRGLQKILGWTPARDDSIYWFENKGKIGEPGSESEFTIWEKSLLGFMPVRPLVEISRNELRGQVHLPAWKAHSCHMCMFDYRTCEGCI